MNIKKLFTKKPLDIEKIYKEHQHDFEMLLIKDFIGYIPKEIQEPVLNIFKDHGEAIERWTLWQSWYVNGKAVNDPVRITVYQGMMIYLKMLNTMARVQQKNYQPKINTTEGKNEEKVVTSYLDEALEGLEFFQNGIKNNKGNQTPKTEGVTEDKNKNTKGK